MSSPASAIERSDPRIVELVAAGSLEISPRELHRAKDVATLLPAGSCVYIPSLPGLPLVRTLEAIAAIREAGLDPVPHVSARRILNRNEFRDFLRRAAAEYGVHRVLLLGGDEPRPKGPYADSLQILEERLLADCGVREIGIAGPTDPAALLRYGQRCGVSVSLRALRNLGSSIAQLVTNTDPQDHLVAVARYARREPSNVVGVHLYSFGGAVRTAAWMSERL